MFVELQLFTSWLGFNTVIITQTWHFCTAIEGCRGVAAAAATATTTTYETHRITHFKFTMIQGGWKCKGL